MSNWWEHPDNNPYLTNGQTTQAGQQNWGQWASSLNRVGAPSVC